MPIKKTHVFRTDERSKRRVLSELNPTLTISVKDQGVAVIQNGQIMTAAGNPMNVDPMPEWLMDQIKLIPDHVMKELGLNPDIKNPPKKAEKPARRTSKANKAAAKTSEPEEITTGDNVAEEFPPQPTQGV
jgi:hypothetical protein